MNAALLSSKDLFWCTPQDFYERLNARLRFTLDPCCTIDSAKCAKFFTPAEDGLIQDWAGERAFVNPPYGRELPKWVHKCACESLKFNTLCVMLIAARPDTAPWHDCIFERVEAKTCKVRFVPGRLMFTDPEGNPPRNAKGQIMRAPFPSAVVAFGSQKLLSVLGACPIGRLDF